MNDTGKESEFVNTREEVDKRLGVNGEEGNPIRLPEVKRERLALLFADLGFTRGVEVGVNLGEFSKSLCLVNPKLHLASVDIWAKADVYLEAIRTLRPFNCELIRLPSIEASKLFDDGSLDFVYIDGDHSYDPVIADIESWEPKVRSGGIVSGHDYKISDETWAARRCKVVNAVNAYVAKNRINPFYVIGESIPVPWPSWFWVKE
jgi:hypothetical protein